MELPYAEFEWDDRKSKSNLRKHQVRFADAIFVFFDPMRIEYLDDTEEYGEPRWKTIGFAAEVLLSVVYTIRGSGSRNIRLISARKARPNERTQYNQTQN